MSHVLDTYPRQTVIATILIFLKTDGKIINNIP